MLLADWSKLDTAAGWTQTRPVHISAFLQFGMLLVFNKTKSAGRPKPVTGQKDGEGGGFNWNWRDSPTTQKDVFGGGGERDKWTRAMGCMLNIPALQPCINSFHYESAGTKYCRHSLLRPLSLSLSHLYPHAYEWIHYIKAFSMYNLLLRESVLSLSLRLLGKYYNYVFRDDEGVRTCFPDRDGLNIMFNLSNQSV